MERYVTRTGYPVPPMDWYFAYNLFRLAGIIQGIKKRVIDGTASSAHARSMSDRVAPPGAGPRRCFALCASGCGRAVALAA